MGGQQGMQMKTGDEFREEQEAKQGSTGTPSPPPAAVPEEPEPMEEDVSDLSSEELKINEDKKSAVEAKLKGNNLYKSKKFDEALATYNEAIALDPSNMTFINNKAAVYFSSKKYDECI